MRFLLDLIENDDITALDDAIRLAMCEIVKSKFDKRDAEILNIFDLDNIPSPFFLTALFSKLSKTAFDDSLF